jgi:hypothetical protein
VEGRKGYKPFPTWGWGEGWVINSFLLVERRKGYKPFPTFGVGKGRVANPSLLLVPYFVLQSVIYQALLASMHSVGAKILCKKLKKP